MEGVVLGRTGLRVHPAGLGCGGHSRLVQSRGASVVEAAYRFCRHEPGVHVVLTGTGDLAHLEQNVASIGAGPLRAADLRRLEEIFGGVDSVSGD